MSQIVYTIKLQKIRDAIRIVSEDEIPLEPFMTFVSQVPLMTPNDLSFSFKRNIWSFTFIFITLLSITNVDSIRPRRFVFTSELGKKHLLTPAHILLKIFQGPMSGLV